MIIDRFIHLFVAVIFLLGFIKLSNLKLDNRALFLGFLSMAIGSLAPDWDLLLGIGYHRSPLTHSVLPALLFGWFVFKRKMPIILIIGFSIGLASHLFWDIIAYGNVQWIKGGNNDRLFLLINSIVLIVATAITKVKKS